MDNNDTTFKKLVTTIEDFLQVARVNDAKEKPTITMTTDLYEDLGIDSLEAMDLVTEIEKKFNISVEAKDLMSKNKISDLAQYIKKLKIQKS